MARSAVLFLWFTASLVAAGPILKDEVLCEACSETVEFLKAGVTDRILHAKTTKTLEAICSSMPPHRSDGCREVISGLTQETLSKLLANLDPMDLCRAMTACPANMDLPVLYVPKVVPNVGEDACELCEELVKIIDSFLVNKTDPEKANATVMAFCNALPTTLRQTCITFAPLLVDMLIKGVDPEGACTNLGICLDAPVAVREVPQSNVDGMQDSPACELCELVVQYVDQYLHENSSKAAINATVYQLCGDLPDQLKTTCLQYAPMIVNAITQGVDPKQACTDIKLCDSTENRVSQKGPAQDSPACELCELVVQYVDQYLHENASKAAINATVYQLCGDLPDQLKTICLQYAPMIVNAITQGVDPKQACTAIKLCDSTENRVSQRAIQIQDSPACELCELVVQYVDQYLHENSSKAAINATVYQLCGDLPDQLKTTCLQYAPMIVNAITQGVDPKQACTAIKLCDSTGNLVFKRADEDKVPTKTVECELCEILVQSIDDFLKNNRTEAAINATIYKLCGDLPSPLKETCTTFAPEIVRVLEQGVDPQTACTAIKLCAAAKPEVAQNGPASQDPPKHGIVCKLCKLLVTMIDKYLNESLPIKAINYTIIHFCNSLPESLKKECLIIGPKLVTLLSEGLNPELACDVVRACFMADKEMFQGSMEVKAPSATPQCELCELIVQAVDDFLKENKTEAAINATVYKLCGDLPASIKGTCLSFAPQIVNALVQGVDPKQACTVIKLCTSGSGYTYAKKREDNGRFAPKESTLLSQVLLKHGAPSPVGEDGWCTFCKIFFTNVDKEVLKEEGPLLQMLEGICHRLPPPTDQACLQAVDSEVPKIFEKFFNGTTTPDTICQVLTLCK